MVLSIGGNDSGFGNVVSNALTDELSDQFVKIGHYERFNSNSDDDADKIYHPQYSCEGLGWCTMGWNCWECNHVLGSNHGKNKWYQGDMGSNLNALADIYKSHLMPILGSYTKNYFITNYPNSMKKVDGTTYNGFGPNANDEEKNEYPKSIYASCSGYNTYGQGDEIVDYKNFEHHLQSDEVEYLSNSFHKGLNGTINKVFPSNNIIDVESNPTTRMWGHGIGAEQNQRWINTPRDVFNCKDCLINCNPLLKDVKFGFNYLFGDNDINDDNYQTCLQCSMHPNKKGYEEVYAKPIAERLTKYFKDELKLGLSRL
jgi:hypothetical protein